MNRRSNTFFAKTLSGTNNEDVLFVGSLNVGQELEDLRTHINTIEITTIPGIEDDVYNIVNVSLPGLQEEVNTNKSDIDDIQQALVTLDTVTLPAINSQITTLNDETIPAITGDIDAILADINDVIKPDITKCQEDIQTLKGNVTDLQNGLQTTNDDVAVLMEAINGNDPVVTQSQATILQNNIDAVDDRVDTTNTNLATLATLVGTKAPIENPFFTGEPMCYHVQSTDADHRIVNKYYVDYLLAYKADSTSITDLQTSLNLKAPILSPSFTGSPTCLDLVSTDANDRITNKVYVDNAVAPKANQTDLSALAIVVEDLGTEVNTNKTNIEILLQDTTTTTNQTIEGLQTQINDNADDITALDLRVVKLENRPAMVYKDTFDVLVQYVINDVVQSSGNTYICVLDYDMTLLTPDYLPSAPFFLQLGSSLEELQTQVTDLDLRVDNLETSPFMSYQGTFDPLRTYDLDDVVFYSNVLCLCVSPYVPTLPVITVPDLPFFVVIRGEIGPAGPTGPQGAKGFTFVGPWNGDNLFDYRIDDVISFDGNTYICMQAYSQADLPQPEDYITEAEYNFQYTIALANLKARPNNPWFFIFVQRGEKGEKGESASDSSSWGGIFGGGGSIVDLGLLFGEITLGASILYVYTIATEAATTAASALTLATANGLRIDSLDLKTINQTAILGRTVFTGNLYMSDEISRTIDLLGSSGIINSRALHILDGNDVAYVSLSTAGISILNEGIENISLTNNGSAMFARNVSVGVFLQTDSLTANTANFDSVTMFNAITGETVIRLETDGIIESRGLRSNGDIGVYDAYGELTVALSLGGIIAPRIEVDETIYTSNLVVRDASQQPKITLTFDEGITTDILHFRLGECYNQLEFHNDANELKLRLDTTGIIQAEELHCNIVDCTDLTSHAITSTDIRIKNPNGAETILLEENGNVIISGTLTVNGQVINSTSTSGSIGALIVTYGATVIPVTCSQPLAATTISGYIVFPSFRLEVYNFLGVYIGNADNSNGVTTLYQSKAQTQIYLNEIAYSIKLYKKIEGVLTLIDTPFWLDTPHETTTPGAYYSIGPQLIPICSTENLGFSNCDQGFVVQPGYKLNVYESSGFTTLLGTLDNITGMTPLFMNSFSLYGNSELVSSVRLYKGEIQIHNESFTDIKAFPILKSKTLQTTDLTVTNPFVGATLSNGAFYIVGPQTIALCFSQELGLKNRDSGFLVSPGYKLEVYSGTLPLLTLLGTINNTAGTFVYYQASQTLYGNTKQATHVKLYEKNAELVNSSFTADNQMLFENVTASTVSATSIASTNLTTTSIASTNLTTTSINTTSISRAHPFSSGVFMINTNSAHDPECHAIHCSMKRLTFTMSKDEDNAWVLYPGFSARLYGSLDYTDFRAVIENNTDYIKTWYSTSIPEGTQASIVTVNGKQEWNIIYNGLYLPIDSIAGIKVFYRDHTYIIREISFPYVS